MYPDHVVVSGVKSSSFGVFNSDTVTFEDMDVGPATISTNCQILQGPGMENKIGSGGVSCHRYPRTSPWTGW